MIVAITGIVGVGQTFMDWSVNYLCGAKRYWQYELGQDPKWHELSHNPVGGNNAHGHIKSHPGVKGSWEYQSWLDEAIKVDNEFPIVFYPAIGSDTIAHGHDYLEEIEIGTKLLNEKGCKVIFLKRMSHFPLFLERISLALKDRVPRDIATILGEEGLPDRLIRKKLSVGIFARQKTLLEKYDSIIERCNDSIDLVVPDKDWHWHPQDTIKKVFETLGLTIDQERFKKWVPISEQWQVNQKKLYHFHEKLLPDIAKAIVDNEDIDWPDWEMDIVQEAMIMAWIMRNHKKKLELPDDHFPYDPKYLHRFIK
jgi:hypothetical protein